MTKEKLLKKPSNILTWMIKVLSIWSSLQKLWINLDAFLINMRFKPYLRNMTSIIAENYATMSFAICLLILDQEIIQTWILCLNYQDKHPKMWLIRLELIAEKKDFMVSGS